MTIHKKALCLSIRLIKLLASFGLSIGAFFICRILIGSIDSSFISSTESSFEVGFKLIKNLGKENALTSKPYLINSNLLLK